MGKYGWNPHFILGWESPFLSLLDLPLMLIIVTSIIDTKAEQFIENNLRKTQIIVELKVL